MEETARKAGRWTVLQVLLGLFVACLIPATVISVALGFDLLVPPPAIADTLDFPSRLQAIQPFREARWPFDAASTLLFVIGFAALAMAAGPIASLAEQDGRAGVLRASILGSGMLGVVGGLLYLGGTQVTIASSYCDCGFIVEETISRFWAINIVQGATDWLSYGAVSFGALGVALSALVLGGRGLPRGWPLIAWSAAVLLGLSVVLHELSDTPAGDLAIAVASGVLLPAWAVILAMGSDRLRPEPM